MAVGRGVGGGIVPGFYAEVRVGSEGRKQRPLCCHCAATVLPLCCRYAAAGSVQPRDMTRTALALGLGTGRRCGKGRGGGGAEGGGRERGGGRVWRERFRGVCLDQPRNVDRAYDTYV